LARAALPHGFTLGFGIGMSVVTNNVSALAALANGPLPMREVAQFEAERRHLLEMELRQSGFMNTDDLQTSRSEFEDNADLAPRRHLRYCTRTHIGHPSPLTIDRGLDFAFGGYLLR
jgi:hypothetical protein